MRSLSTVNRLRSTDLGSFWELRFRNGLVEQDLVAVGIDPRESAVCSPLVRQRGCNLDAALADLLVVCHDVRYRHVDLNGASLGLPGLNPFSLMYAQNLSTSDT